MNPKPPQSRFISPREVQVLTLLIRSVALSIALIGLAAAAVSIAVKPLLLQDGPYRATPLATATHHDAPLQ
jgi:hypothetical protein